MCHFIFLNNISVDLFFNFPLKKTCWKQHLWWQWQFFFLNHWISVYVKKIFVCFYQPTVKSWIFFKRFYITTRFCNILVTWGTIQQLRMFLLTFWRWWTTLDCERAWLILSKDYSSDLPLWLGALLQNACF